MNSAKIKSTKLKLSRPTFTLYYNLEDPRLVEYLLFWDSLKTRFAYIDFLTVNSSKYAGFDKESSVKNWPCVTILFLVGHPEIISGLNENYIIHRAEIINLWKHRHQQNLLRQKINNFVKQS